MNKNLFYVKQYPSGSVTYGKICRTYFFFTEYINLGIKTSDKHTDCMAAAKNEIYKLDLTANIKELK